MAGRKPVNDGLSATTPFKPPLLEYWKPPKAVVFAPSVVKVNESVDRNKQRDLEATEQQATFPSGLRDTNLQIQRDEFDSGFNSIASSPGLDRRNKRFTWADSTTTLVGTKDLERTGSLKSVPWGYDTDWEKRRPRVSEREITLSSANMGGPPAYGYRIDDEDTLLPPWWQIQYWSPKKLIALGVGVAATIAIIVAIVVEVEKKNAYPNYNSLNYTMVDQFTSSNFFDNFNYFDDTDPTNGWVQYVDAQTASQSNLTYEGTSSAVLRVDTSDTNAMQGRKSVRITSKNTWDNGLFIFDVIHSPYGCATWPALWLSDVPNWPSHGEIDVMEQVNTGTDGNIMTLHTSNDCDMKVKRKETGSVSATNCYNGTNDNAGCGVTGDSATYGEAFNKKGGGIMAMELRPAGIRIWQFLRSNIPSDITSNTPDPSSWGEALADFPNTDCDIESHFKNLTIIANIEICGDWAGATDVYTTQDSCPGTCTEYATTNATAFETAYFEFGNFSIYQSPSLN